MPVPIPTSGTPAPRRLLRDVVFDKMLAAIGDGTLELGERLNDDELVRWLGVSRTPVREAIAKLADFGLVDIEANRYTRIISPTVDEAVDTLLSALGLWSLTAQRAVEVMSDAQAAEFMRRSDDILAAFERRDPEYALLTLNLLDFLGEVANSPSLARMSDTVASRAALLSRKAEEAYQWGPGKAIVDQLRTAVEKRDPELARTAFPRTDYTDVWGAKLRELGVFKS